MINKKDDFIKMILNDQYISWLENFMKTHCDIDDLYFLKEQKLNRPDEEMIECLDYLFTELSAYFIKHNDYKGYIYHCFLRYNNTIYKIAFAGNCYICKTYPYPLYENNDGTMYASEYYKDKSLDNPREVKYIEYTDFKASYVLDEELNLNNNSISKLDDLIQKVLDNPSSFYSQICESLTPEERTFITTHLLNKDCSNCKNISCQEDKSNSDDDRSSLKKNCNNWINQELIGKSKVLRKLDIHKLI